MNQVKTEHKFQSQKRIFQLFIEGLVPYKSQRFVCALAGWPVIWRGKTLEKSTRIFWYFVGLVSPKKKYDKKKLNLFFQHASNGSLNPKGLLNGWHPIHLAPFGGSRFLSILFSIHQCVYPHWTSPTFWSKKKCEWLTFLLMLCCIPKKTESIKLFHQKFNMELWTYDDVLTKKNISFFQLALFFSQSHLECMSIHFRTKMQHTFSLTEQIPQAEKEKCKS